MTQRLAKKVALVTGAGSSAEGFGLSNGEAAALAFAREGAAIMCADIRSDAAELAAQRIVAAGGRASSVACDVSKSADVRTMVDATLQAFGRIDILHNNVGIEAKGGPVETDEDAWDRVHAVNVKSVFLTCKTILPLMEAQGGGVIINVSSTASLRWSGVPYIAYNSSKAALNHVTRIVARQYAGKQIRCNAIVPGYMATPHIRTLYRELDDAAFADIMAQRDAKCPMGRQGTSQDIANAAVFLASDDASYITGNLLVVDGGASI